MKLLTSRNEKFIILSVMVIFFVISVGFALSFNENQYLNVEDSEIKTSQGLIFDGLVANYTFRERLTYPFWSTYNTEFRWSQKADSWFNVTWNVPGGDLSTWLENRNTRIIDNETGPWAFIDHTPMWIFNNVSVSDIVLLCVDGDGDHPYMVIKEFVYYLPGFGSIEVWQLEHFIIPGFYAYYEKSTGLLIKGDFPLIADNYTLEINYTNANFNYVTPISKIFDGLYMHYNASFNGLPLVPTNFTYEQVTPNDYNVTWFSFLGGTGTWMVEVSTRVMSNFAGSTFAPGTHEPAWIHTNVSLYDIVPIAIDAHGDHIFNITGELIYDLAGYGSIAVWFLEDILNPNCTAWYEKSTGILIKGTFIWPGGNYTLDLLRTNALFQYITPPGGIPGYHLFIFVTLCSVVSLVIIIQKRMKK